MAAVPGIHELTRPERSTLEGRALWRWAAEAACRVEPAEYLASITGEGAEHRVWYARAEKRYFKATFAGRYGWIATLDLRYNKRTQEDEPFIGMGDATPGDYLDRLALQNEVFGDDIRIEALTIEKEGLVILTSQPLVRGKPPQPAQILSGMAQLGFERIPGIPANSEDCFSFYRRKDRVAAFDAHTGNFFVTTIGILVPIDLVMVRADDAFHDYTCRRIDTAKL